MEHSEAFESDQILDAQNELTEFNEDVEDMAFELAYTRYALAKAEKRIEELEVKKVKLSKAQKALFEELKESMDSDGTPWTECKYPKEWRTAKSLESKGLVEVEDDEPLAKKTGWFVARIKDNREVK